MGEERDILRIYQYLGKLWRFDIKKGSRAFQLTLQIEFCSWCEKQRKEDMTDLIRFLLVSCWLCVVRRDECGRILRIILRSLTSMFPLRPPHTINHFRNADWILTVIKSLLHRSQGQQKVLKIDLASRKSSKITLGSGNSRPSFNDLSFRMSNVLIDG